MLTIENLQFRYGKRSPQVLRGVDLTLQDGDFVTVLGSI